jgi:uncharacterized membrane protein
MAQAVGPFFRTDEICTNGIHGTNEVRHVESKWWVLIFMVLTAMFIGVEAFAKVVNVPTRNLGYILGILSFMAGIVIGARKR